MPKLKPEDDLLAKARFIYIQARADGDPTDWARDEAVAKTTPEVIRLWKEVQKFQTIMEWRNGTQEKVQAADTFRKHKWQNRIDGQLSAWEAEYLAQQTAHQAVAAFDQELAKLQLMTDSAKNLLDKAVAHYSKDATTGNAQSYSICYKNWIDASERLSQHLGSRVARSAWDAKRPTFEQAREKAFKAIFKDYNGKGQAYRLLCQRAASAWATLEQLEASGILPGNPEHSKVNGDFLAIIAQIQKYTETLKSEIQETKLHDFGDRILKIVERNLQNQPVVMKRILAEVEGEPIDVTPRLLSAG